ncbi:hypothetical protein ACIBTP_29595 [Streptomyces avidinii]|uniref:hypothetical protein n=1 Tax=Streptomyces avidinii TaxID=1895 RepID=UPI0037B3D1E7
MAEDVVERVAARQFSRAVAAVATMAPGLLIALPGMLAGLFLLTAIPVVIPPPGGVRRNCSHGAAWSSASCCSAGRWSLVTSILGMIFFLPTALLLIAAFADSGNRPGAWVVLGGGGDTLPPPSTFYRAAIDSPERFNDSKFRSGVQKLKEYGATYTYTYTCADTANWRGHVYLTVDYRADASPSWLKWRIENLPGVTEVRLCTSLACDGK